MSIEYFKVGASNNPLTATNHFETTWEREEREKNSKKVNNFKNKRRIIGYTLGYTASHIKENLIRMLDSSNMKKDQDA